MKLLFKIFSFIPALFWVFLYGWNAIYPYENGSCTIILAKFIVLGFFSYLFAFIYVLRQLYYKVSIDKFYITLNSINVLMLIYALVLDGRDIMLKLY
jgi:hypothetical protein